MDLFIDLFVIWLLCLICFLAGFGLGKNGSNYPPPS